MPSTTDEKVPPYEETRDISFKFKEPISVITFHNLNPVGQELISEAVAEAELVHVVVEQPSKPLWVISKQETEIYNQLYFLDRLAHSSYSEGLIMKWEQETGMHGEGPSEDQYPVGPPSKLISAARELLNSQAFWRTFF